MMNPSLLEQMKAELAVRKGHWPTIARQAGVGYVWLFKVMQGRIKDPGASRIERVLAVIRRDPPRQQAA